MHITDLLKRESVELNGSATDKKDALEKMVSLMVKQGNIEDPEEYKKMLGISNVSLKKTTWCRNKSRDVKIVVDFDLNSKLPYFTMAPRHYRVYASTRVWSGV